MTTYTQGNGEIHNIKGIAPTQREDGSELPLANISHYIQFLSYNGGVYLESAVVLINGKFGKQGGSAAEDIDIDNTVPGVYTYWYRTVDMGGRQSVDSEMATLEILRPLAMPNPPTGIAVG